jgi:mannose-6-phosphate isomerase-like protein (cupin superfamily)
MARSRAAAIKPAVIGFEEGESLDFAGVHGLLKIDGVDAGERFALAYFPFIPPHVLAAPLHRHHREDEYTWVVEGTLGVQLGDEVVTAAAGTMVIKPRGQWHTFWNAADTPCRTIEIVSPAGFQRYFSEVAALGGDPNRVAELNAKYSLDMDFESVPVLCKRFNLHFPA